MNETGEAKQPHEDEWVNLTHYLSDLSSILDGVCFDGSQEGLELRSWDGYGWVVRVSRAGGWWSIRYESNGIEIKVSNGRAELRGDGKPTMVGEDAGAGRNAGKAFACVVGLVAAASLGTEETFFSRFFKNIQVVGGGL